MSFFLAYFETNNPKSTNYSEFKDVGKFSVPHDIYGGQILILHETKSYNAAIISDETRQCANNLFVKNESRKILFNFIESRIRLSHCIMPALGGFIMKNNQNSISAQKIEIVKLDYFKNNFSMEIFKDKIFWKIIS